MSEAIQQKMDLSRLKQFLDSAQNIEFLSQIEESVDFSTIIDAYGKMRYSENDQLKAIPASSPQQDVDIWLLASFNSFDLGDIFYMGIQEFRNAPWVKVKTSGASKDWLLPLYYKLSARWITFAPLALNRIFEFRDLEHEFITISGKI
jgi:hypothetical protein